MSKKALLVVGILFLIMGILGMIPSWTLTYEPDWYAILQIVIGLVSIYISKKDY